MRLTRSTCIVLAAFALIAAIMKRLAQLRRAASLAGPSVPMTPYGCPVPPVIHRRIEKVKPGRLIVVGDLHGTPELFWLLDKLQYDSIYDNLILAGDLVNKGPASLAVLDAVHKLNCWAVRGNHDDAALSAWLRFRHGGEPLNPKFEWVQRMTDEQASILLDLPFTVSIPEYGIAVVHAGLVPGVPLEQQDMWDMYKMRNLVPEQHQQKEEAEGRPQSLGGEGAPTHVSLAGSANARTVAVGGQPRAAPPRAGHADAPTTRYRAVEKAKDGGKAWAALWRGPPHVFFGHDARRRLQLAPYATGLDTGCVYGGQLTAAVMPSLAELRVCSPDFVSRMQSGRAVRRKDLRVVLTAVEAAAVYSPPGGGGTVPVAAAVEPPPP